ncbi:protein kinase domain-containing protein [Dermatobacter hominis]|uniref:protein kinase domain-containing protein n=1 Tax=Dermatobacter hominis TaxID=2884263 RepID=UPI001D109A47|nr:protein kinase [Dermatobacter hominis]UDY37156.1 protein kinase [Dermatobacter hominis]
MEGTGIGVGRASVPTNLPSGIRLGEVVGVGATSTVWRARDRRRGRDLAVKVLAVPAGGEARERTVARFEHETRALARLADAPHVLPLLTAGSDGSCCWLVTPLAEAGLFERAPLALADLLDVAAATAGALEAAHAAHVVHGDVTPANVLWLDGRPVLSDFGLSVLRSGEAGLRTDGAAPGDPAARGATPGWAAPERWDGAPPTEASDVYGWGATIWTAGVGERPPGHDPPPVGLLPRGIDAIVRACCEPTPRRRPSAAEVRAMVAGEVRRRDRYCPEP